MNEDQDLRTLIDTVCEQKGIPRDILRRVLEEAMEAAARKKYGMTRDFEAQYNQDTDEVELYDFRTVVEEVEDPDIEITLDDAARLDPDCTFGDELGIKLEVGDLGRIAAQTAKQVIIQKIRDAERERIFNEYKDRQGELITGTVRRFDRGNLIVELNTGIEAVLPSREQVHTESYRPGDRIQAYIVDIARNTRGPQIILSRTHPGLVVKLFEIEVPEIYEGVVAIERCVREPGHRAKIAVSSRDADVDPVGACVGMKGSRVQAVVAELRGEKIDIIPFSPDPARFVCAAIAPATVTKVIIDEDARTMELIVVDDQLSLAIGRRGQNVRLASQLTEWKIDIHSETRMAEMNAQAREQMSRIESLDEASAEVLIRYGFRSIQDVADAEPEDLADMLQVEPEFAAGIVNECDDILNRELEAEIARKQTDEPEAEAEAEVEEG